MSGTWDVIDEVLPFGYVILYLRESVENPQRFELRLGKYNPRSLSILEKLYERLKPNVDE